MKYVATVWFESRCGETDYEDIKSMEKKIRDYIALVVAENNSSNRHLGLHLKMIDYGVWSTPYTPIKAE